VLHFFSRNLIRALRWFARKHGHHFYPVFREFQDIAAQAYFLKVTNSVGAAPVVHHPYRLINPNYLIIGNSFCACAGTRIEAIDTFGDQSFSPQIVIGDRVQLNFNVHIGAIGTLTIGDDVLIGSNVLITDHSHGGTGPGDLQTRAALRKLVSKGPTVIEDNVWIGEGACILGGVRVGHNSIVGANAVVTCDVPPYSVVAGVPARKV
jgi:acetyltransferase-like isoleucine patch superfamily enzyme